MKYDPRKHHRRSIRLKGYDYSQPGGYYITIVTQNRKSLFGDVVDGKMVLNTFGRIIAYHWQKLPIHFKHIKLDVYQIMPNHLHGIIIITDNVDDDHGRDRGHVGAKHSSKIHLEYSGFSCRNALPLQHPQQPPHPPQHPTRPNGTQRGSLSAIMQNFLSVTTRKINRIRKTPGQKLWQRNFWEHIIRNENDLNRIRAYIQNNPSKWQSDRTNPFRSRNNDPAS